MTISSQVISSTTRSIMRFQSFGFLVLVASVAAARGDIRPADCLPRGAQASDCTFVGQGVVSFGALLSESLTMAAPGGRVSWSTLTTTSPPKPRYFTNMLFEPGRDRLVVFAGRPSDPLVIPYSDLWTLDGATGTWTRQHPGGLGALPGRERSSAVYDSDRDRVVIYGGLGGPYLNDVWSFDYGSQLWREISTTGISPHYRTGHCAAYDSAAHRMIVFGGYYYDNGWHKLPDVWSLDLDTQAWSALTTVGPRPDLFIQGCTYDPTRRQLHAYGAVDDSGNSYPEHLWTLDIATLTWNDMLIPGENPGPRDSFSLANDEQSHSLVLQGGHYYDGVASFNYNDIWSLDLSSLTWSQIVPKGETPPVLFGHAAAYDTSSNMYVFGGLIDGSSLESNSTFVMQASKAPQCENGACDDCSVIRNHGQCEKCCKTQGGTPSTCSRLCRSFRE